MTLGSVLGAVAEGLVGSKCETGTKKNLHAITAMQVSH